jgi:hypothetical protein
MGEDDTMDVEASVDIAAAPDLVRPWVDDLSRYGEWLTIIPRAEPIDGEAASWDVELRAKVGPIARSKRLRMRRTADTPDHLRFERDEVDGREHSPWVLDIELVPIATGTHLRMTLHYGGSFGGGIVERLLAAEIDSSRERLRAVVERGTATP